MKTFKSLNSVIQLNSNEMRMLVGGEKIPVGTKRTRETNATINPLGVDCCGDVVYEEWCGECWVDKGMRYNRCDWQLTAPK